MNILIIEDDVTISFAIDTFLRKHNFETAVFSTLESTMDVDFNSFDLLILDANLPDGCGFDFLEYVKNVADIPVIMLTVKDSEESILQGFSSGADDYVTKPFSLPVLKARIDNVLGRKNRTGKKTVYKGIILDSSLKTLSIDGKNITLSRQEFAILNILLENMNTNVIREIIIDKVWGNDSFEVNDNTLTVTVKRLRNKLGDYGNCIKTVRGIGYRWEGDNDE